MGIAANLIWAFLSLVCTGVEIVMFFIIVRMIQTLRKLRLLEPFDFAGKNLVDLYLNFVQKIWYKFALRTLNSKACLLIGLAALIIFRFIIIIFSSLLCKI